HRTYLLSYIKRIFLAKYTSKLIVVDLKIFLRFLLRRRMISRDPSETLSLPRIERYLPETLNEIQVQQLLDAIDIKTELGLRDRAIVELLYASGLLISELTAARLEQ